MNVWRCSQKLIAATRSPTEGGVLKRDLEEARRELALAAAVSKQAKRQVSSVAPLFLQPERETGQLVRIEGVARRAVRIAANRPNLDGYYEMEVFPSDSQNLPVVCCLSSLPAEFPKGDEIREHVRVDGLFFKSWRYRTRKNLADSGQTDRQQQLYTPVVVGGAPTWLPRETNRPNQWAAWGGFGFLAALAILWIVMISLAKRDRLQRAALHAARLENLKDEY